MIRGRASQLYVDFRAQLATLYTRVLETWYDQTVPNVTATYLSSVLGREDKIAIGIYIYLLSYQLFPADNI